MEPILVSVCRRHVWPFIACALCLLGLTAVQLFAKGPVAQHQAAGAKSVAVVAAAVPTPAPLLVASTYLGGPGFDITWACAADSDGNVYIAGDTQNPEFPVTDSAVQKN